MSRGFRKVTIVIPVWNSGKWIAGCLSSLSCQTYTNFDVVLVDNGSEDGSIEVVKKATIPNLSIISLKKNYGFAVAVNVGVKSTKTPYVALLNVDTLPDSHWLERLVDAMDKAPDYVTSLASKMLIMDSPELIDSAGDLLSWYGTARKRGHGEDKGKFDQQDCVFSACAGAALYRASLFNEVGYFDERFTSYFEDIDLGFREKLYGYKTLYVPEAIVLHQGHSAGVTGGYYVFLLTRNRLLTLIKNVPVAGCFRHLFQILYGQLYFLLVYKHPMASVRGYLSAFFLLPDVLKDRKKIQASRKEKLTVVDNILDSTLGEPSLIALLWKKIL
jgi:GT2 family glycosyltransferase